MIKRRWVVTMAVTITLVAAAAVTALVAPTVTAVACPQCHRLTSLGDRVYADRADAGYAPMLAAARRRIATFYGEPVSRPRVLICSTAECYHRLGGGGEKGQSVLTWGLMLSPAGATETIATHELSHVEFHARLGPALGKVPQWFDEGLAAVVSEDARYLRSGADRCLVPYDEALKVTATDWRTATRGGDDAPYRLAACVVSRWLGSNGGPPAVASLVERLRAGDDFAAVVTG